MTSRRVCVVGGGTRFVSGISYYTYYLAGALAADADVSTILMRRLLPRRLYPGRSRVGAAITELRTVEVGPCWDGVDWFLLPSLVGASRFLAEQRPDYVVFQWWTGTVLPAYLALAAQARRSGAKVMIELHEDLDTGEARIPLVGRVVRAGLRRLVRRSDGVVVHSAWDRDRLCEMLGLGAHRVLVVPLGPFSHADRRAGDRGAADRGAADLRAADRGAADLRAADLRAAGADPPAPPAGDGPATTVMFFGTIRPYKGLETLVDAFDLLPRGAGREWRLLIVGETWQGWDLPLRKAATSPFASDIELVNRYVTDAELAALIERAGVVALPYLRSSASGPLHLAMHRGLPVVVTRVGGLPEAVEGYAGAVLVDAGDPAGLAAGISRAAALPGPHLAPHSWEATRAAYAALMDDLAASSASRR